MLASWLDSTEREPNPYSQFRLIDMKEVCALSEPIRSYIAALLREARFDPAFLEAMAAHLGWGRVKDAIVSGGVPNALATKRGDFGEILIMALLEEMYGYKIPVNKLRFKITRDQLMPGTDALALRVNSEGVIVEVCYVESKLRTAIRGEQDRMVAVTGCQQLKKDYDSNLPEILRFVAARLHDTHDELFGVFGEYIRTRQDTTDLDTFRLGLFWDHEAWDERVLKNLEDHSDVVPKLVVHTIRIHHLGPISDELFVRVGVLEVSDDD
jgi:hypothetical protein